MACLECYYYDSDAVALAGASAKISPSDQALFQFFHETVPENERLGDTQCYLAKVLAGTWCTVHTC